MTPTPDHDRGADERPSVAEVAALTRRLRELSAQGRRADPAERAAFLADKDALMQRITATDRDAGRILHTHAAVRGRLAAADASGAAAWLAQARTAEPDTPAITFDQSGYSDADIAAIGDALAAGDIEGAQQLQDRPWTAQGTTVDTGHGTVSDAGPVPYCTLIDAEQQEARREQLTRWHTDNTTAEGDGTVAGDDRRDSALDDGPGLP